MQIKEKVVRKFLSKKIQQLNNIVADLDSLVTELGSDYFRVSIFGATKKEHTLTRKRERVQSLLMILLKDGMHRRFTSLSLNGA